MGIQIKGEVMRIIFSNSDNNYRIFTVSNNENTFTLCGYIPKIEEGLSYEFECEETYHPRYGNQYKVLTYQSIMENSREGIINYLSSNLFPGVGLICAEKVYNELGDKMSIVSYTSSERDLLARLMRAEALGEGNLGMLMVGNVAVNRAIAD